ncbi:MAG: ABC transporter permease, partial [Bacilli bacterium]
MNKFFIVLFHTYLTKLKSKTFIVTTIIFALFVGVGFNLPNIISLLNKDEMKQVGVVDSSGVVAEALTSMPSDGPNSAMPFIGGGDKIEYVAYPDEGEAKNQLNDNTIKGYVLVDSVDNGLINATFKANKLNVDEQQLAGKVQQSLSQVQLGLLVNDLKLSQQDAAKLFQPVVLNKEALSKDAKSEDELALSIALVYVLLFALYISSLMYGNLVAMEVATEKSSRVMEILISSVSPAAHMFGKIIGIALLGLTQFALMISIAYTSSKFGDKKISLDGINIDFSEIPVGTVIYAVVFYILGYLLYSTMAAMLGSLVSRTEEL